MLQRGPETFDVWVAGRWVRTHLPHHTRRGLNGPGTPPAHVAAEMVRFLAERGVAVEDEADLGRAVGRFPEGMEELRSRLA